MELDPRMDGLDGLILIPWSDLPGNVCEHLVDHYVRSGKYRKDTMMENLVKEHNISWYSPTSDADWMSRLVFTEAQYTLFLLKWS